jgi:hypothetical protein
MATNLFIVQFLHDLIGNRPFPVRKALADIVMNGREKGSIGNGDNLRLRVPLKATTDGLSAGVASISAGN